MAIRFPKEDRQRMIASIRRYSSESLEEEMGDLAASLLLDFFLKEIGPSVYNRAVADARAFMEEKAADLDGACFEPEFGYWKR